MRISLNWLRELVETTLSPTELAETLTMAGFEVEDIEDRRTWAEGVVVGYVLERQPHPNADKLSVCQVDIGADRPSTIVCGAANVKAGLYVPVATLGTYLPMIDLKIKPAKLRGVQSEGMICSLAELGLAKESSGIHNFEVENLTVGQDVRPLLGLDDVILDLTSTANRADALSMVGIARELAALTGAKLKLPQPQPWDRLLAGEDLTLRLSERAACPAYIGTMIEQVTIAPSPAWLQQRLQSAGVRPINNVVDATNYVLLEWGQPLHAFDCDRLQAVAQSQVLQVGVRFAEPGETLTTLDGQTRNLTDTTLLITANDHPVALAGVMGGEATEVYAGTTNLFLEAALFDPAAIRRSARSQGLRTEASARYERGINQAELSIACRRALDLITQLAGGTVTHQVMTDLPQQQAYTRSIELRLDRINQILGPIQIEGDLGELPAQSVETILTNLGCTITPITPEQSWSVTVPPYRYRDLEREIDLIEEVARVYGYNNFCDTLPEKTEPGYLSIEAELKRKIREAFRAVGLTEVTHYSVTKPSGGRQIVLTNPLFSEYAALRTDLIAGLVDAFQYNLEQGNGALNAFEVGRIFWSEEEGFNEAEVLGGIMGGDPTKGKWQQAGRDRPINWYEAKGRLENALQRLGLVVEYQPDRRDERLHPGRTASLWIGGTRLGTFGQLHPQLRRDRGLPEAVYVFELDLEVMLDELNDDTTVVRLFQPYSPYPSSGRDIAFFVSTKTAVAELERTIRQTGGSLLESLELFDEYRGEGVADGQRSLAFRLIYRASDRTLTEDDIEPVHQKIRESLVEKFRVELRS